MDKKIFFRDDDADELSDNLTRLIDIFSKHKIPLHLAVIPAKLTDGCAEYLKSKIEESNGLIEVGQHGFQHENYSESEDKLAKYEFGSSRTIQQQRKDILNGRGIIKKKFNDSTDIFTPPWHGFDSNTIQILADEKFKGMSGTYSKNLPVGNDRLSYIPIHINFNKIKENGTWYTEKNTNMIKRILGNKNEYVGILLHHKAFNTDVEFSQLDHLLECIKNIDLTDCTSLSKIVEKSVNNNLCHEAVAYFLNYQFVPKPLVVTKDSINQSIEKFDFNYSDIPGYFSKDENKICEDLYVHLKKTIEKQLPAKDKPVGILLSGGFDSAAILHILRELTDRKIYTLTGAFQENDENLIFAEQLAQKYNTIHDNYIITPKNIKEIDELYAHDIPQPIGDNGLLSAYLLIKKIKENTSYIFSGEGADCLFCGLKMHQLNLSDNGGMDVYEHYKFGEIFLSTEELRMLFEENGDIFNLEAPLKQIVDRIKVKDPIKRQVLLDLNYLVKNRVDYIYYAAKANGLDINLPYLDRKFIDFAFRIPGEYLITRSYQKKYILKKAFANKIPQEILDRCKEGFSPPFKQWYYHNKKFVAQKLKQARKLGISTEYIIYLLSNIKNSTIYAMGMKIWLLINLVSWHEHSSKALR